MKININAELTGKDIVNLFLNQLSVQEMQFKPQEQEIKAQVTTKQGVWVDFDIDKIKFIYNK